MADIMMTSGESFEGYEIEEYLGVIDAQSASTSNVFKGFVAGATDVSDSESEKMTARMGQMIDSTLEKLEAIAKRRGANAIIAISIDCSQYANYSMGTLVTGTAVKIRKKESAKDIISKELYVSNYYNRQIPRPVKIELVGEGDSVHLKSWFYNYNFEEIKAVRADVELTNLYEEKWLLKNQDFVFEKGNVSLIEAEQLACKIPAKDILLIKDAKIIISKYVTANGIFPCNEMPINVNLSQHRLAKLKEKRGIDAVEKYITDGMIWTCNCGYVNEAGAEECIICSRKQEEMKRTLKFNPDEMIAKMQEKEYVIELKDVLMEYIKNIDTQYRMELLEIMESGLQYEKVRGNMKQTVIEKVEKVFEGQ